MSFPGSEFVHTILSAGIVFKEPIYLRLQRNDNGKKETLHVDRINCRLVYEIRPDQPYDRDDGYATTVRLIIDPINPIPVSVGAIISDKMAIRESRSWVWTTYSLCDVPRPAPSGAVNPQRVTFGRDTVLESVMQQIVKLDSQDDALCAEIYHALVDFAPRITAQRFDESRGKTGPEYMYLCRCLNKMFVTGSRASGAFVNASSWRNVIKSVVPGLQHRIDKPEEWVSHGYLSSQDPSKDPYGKWGSH